MHTTVWRLPSLVGLALFALITAVPATPLAFGQTERPAQGQAGLRLAHMAPGAPPQVDVFVDGQRVAGPIAYQSVSGLQNVAPGSHELRVSAAGQTDAALTARQDMAADKTYTVVVTGGPGDLGPVVLEDDLTPAPEGRGRLRFVNAVPNTRVNVATDTGESLFQNVDYRTTTDFREVAAGTYRLVVRDMNTNTELTSIPSVNVPSRGSAAAFATGTAQFGGAPVQQAPPGAMPRTGTGSGHGLGNAGTLSVVGSGAVSIALLVLVAAAIRATRPAPPRR